MSKRPVQKHLFRVLTLSLIILLAGGGIALLSQWHLGSISSYASSDYVVGQPSLPAANVDAIFRQMGSPMVGTGKAVEAASRAQNIDDAFALAVWWTETNDGAAGVGLADRNPGSVRGSIGYPSAYDGYTIYPSYSAAVSYWFMMLKRVYIERGLTTVSVISHPYVGTSTSDLWAGKVITLMQRYRAEAPPPAPAATPAPTIAPDITRQGKQLALEQQQQGKSKSTYYAPVVQGAPTTQARTASVSQGLSGNTRTALVLFDLLLALVLGLWAWSVNRRYAESVQPAPAVSNPWEQLNTHGQQAAAAIQQASNPWELQQATARQQATMQQISNPWELQQAAAIQQVSNPWELQQATARQQAAMQQISNPWELQQAATNSLWEQMPTYERQTTSFFNSSSGPQRTTESLTPDMHSTETLAAAAAEQPNYTASASLFSLEAFMAGQPQFQGPQTLAAPQPELLFAEQQAFVEQQDWPSNLSASSNERTTFAPGPGLARSAQSSFHRMRLQSTEEQPQPISLSSGGGLLSRYREKQVQSEQE